MKRIPSRIHLAEYNLMHIGQIRVTATIFIEIVHTQISPLAIASILRMAFTFANWINFLNGYSILTAIPNHHL